MAHEIQEIQVDVDYLDLDILQIARKPIESKEDIANVTAAITSSKKIRKKVKVVKKEAGKTKEQLEKRGAEIKKEQNFVTNAETIIKGTLGYDYKDSGQGVTQKLQQNDNEGYEIMRNTLRNGYKEEMKTLDSLRVHRVTKSLSVAWRPYINERGVGNKVIHFFKNYNPVAFFRNSHQIYINPQLCLDKKKSELPDNQRTRNDTQKADLQLALKEAAKKTFKKS